MNFSSIKEYFYRLQSRCYALLLLAVALLIVYYGLQRFVQLSFTLQDAETIFLLKIILPAAVVLELTSVHLVMLFKLKSLRLLKGMGERLDGYASWITIKMLIGVSSSLIALVGLALTADDYFIGLYVLCLLFVLLQLPTPNKLSRQLQLKGAEKELIIKGELV